MSQRTEGRPLNRLVPAMGDAHATLGAKPNAKVPFPNGEPETISAHAATRGAE